MPSPSPPPSAALRALGADDELLGILADLAEPGTVPARVVRVDRIRVAVHDGERVRTTDPEHSLVTDPDTGVENLPAVGDWLLVTDADVPAVRVLAPRRGRLVRRDPGQPRPQILAVGVDVVIVTVPLDRPLVIGRVERELVTAFDADAAPVVALTKADLSSEPQEAVAALAPATRDVPVVVVSTVAGGTEQVAGGAREHHGVAQLRDALRPARTGVLLGPSGSGKSTLANAIVGASIRTTGDVRAGDRKGRHTTATRALLPVPTGGTLIDTPGLRALGLWDAAQGLFRAFAEITAVAEGCRFADCTHTGEPGCAVAVAVAEGGLDHDRLERFRALYAELVEQQVEQEEAERNRRRRADRRAPPSRR